jgi:NAD(P)H-dependent FMN reductase
MTTISIIVGSTREGRFSEKVAHWISSELSAREGVQVKMLDLRDFPMPFFDQPAPPGMPGRAPYEHPVVQKWTAAIAASDSFVFVTPEYNHSYPAVLKNAIDWAYQEWNRKAAAFVSYGGVGGARAVEHLRGVAIALELACANKGVHLPLSTLMLHLQGGDVAPALEQAKPQVAAVLDELLWWTRATQAARASAI